jgi:hypothetical protein
MSKDYIGYEALADAALRSIVREALKRTAQKGLLGSHHFYITFKTHDPGVDIPDFLMERYPDEMTIVLQNQFFGLKVTADAFEVGLSFQKFPATLVIPFAAITAFEDRGVSFGLQFRNATPRPRAEATDKSASSALSTPEQEPDADSNSQVVSLNKFRKK